jgi:hypothetical protein
MSATTVQSTTCPAWCHYDAGHASSEPHPEDRVHASAPLLVVNLEL